MEAIHTHGPYHVNENFEDDEEIPLVHDDNNDDNTNYKLKYDYATLQIEKLQAKIKLLERPPLGREDHNRMVRTLKEKVKEKDRVMADLRSRLIASNKQCTNYRNWYHDLESCLRNIEIITEREIPNFPEHKQILIRKQFRYYHEAKQEQKNIYGLDLFSD